MHIPVASLDFALLHVTTYGENNLLPLPFEYQAIQHDWVSTRSTLEHYDVNVWNARPYRRLDAPKNRFGFRTVTQLDPRDMLLYTGLIHAIGAEIETSRIPATSEIIISNRFAPDASGRLYDAASDWNSFQNRCKVLAGESSHVVVTDIADFFSRIYSHPLEGALDATIQTPGAASALKRFIKQLNQSVSYGIPIGPDASFLLGELVLDVIDRALLSEGIQFCRWVDDYRLFVSSQRAAYDALRTVNRALFNALGLNLNQGKTRIQSSPEFLESLLPEQRQEVERLTSQLYTILSEGGIAVDGWLYHDLDFDSLDENTQTKLKELNLVGILEEQAAANQIQQTLVRWVMYRLAQLGNAAAVDVLLDNPEKFYPVFGDVLKYISSITFSDQTAKARISDKLFNLLSDSIIGDSKYFRIWLLSLFSNNFVRNEGELTAILRKYTDDETRREGMLALRAAQAEAYVKTRKQDIPSLPPWSRRAFIVAARSLRGDESEHYYRSLRYLLDDLEQTVVKWVEATQ